MAEEKGRLTESRSKRGAARMEKKGKEKKEEKWRKERQEEEKLVLGYSPS